MEDLLSLKASAGSGKTFSLALRYVSLLFKDEDVNEIICLTFTNKSTDEMKNKIDFFIKQLKDETTVEFQELIKETNLDKKFITNNVDKIEEKYQSSFKRIMTIDSFINKILRHYAEEIGIKSNFHIGLIHPDNEMNKFLKNKEVLSEIKEIFDLLKIPEEKENIKEFLFYLYQHDFQLKCIEEDTNEMEISDLIEYVKLIENLIKTSTNEEEKKQYLISYSRLKENLFIKKIINIYNHFKETIIENKKNTNILNFNDITNITYNYIKTNEKEISHFRCKHLLIDEFQDTSILQYKILEPFFDDIIAHKGTIFYVGDIKQSIYRFRGSNNKLFDFFQKEYNFKTKELLYNYRSNFEIVEYVNIISKGLFNNYTRQLPIINDKQSIIEEVIFDTSSIKKELNYIVSKIKLHNYSLKDITILCRTNKDIDFIISEVIEEINIKKQEFIKLIDIPEINKLLKDNDDLRKILSKIQKSNLEEKIKEVLIKEIDKYDDYKDFEYNIENLKIEKINNSEEDYINIMTIHKSKGLEFKNVIVFDYMKDSFDIEDNLFFISHSPVSFSLYLNFADREKFDEDFLNILYEKRKIEKEDKDNLLYVAITRAKDNLFLLKNREVNKSFFN